MCLEKPTMLPVVECTFALIQLVWALCQKGQVLNLMAENKLRRINFKTYLHMLGAAVGSSMFRHWYVESQQQGEFDAMKDGENSCAFFVSSILRIFDKVSAIHGTVESTVRDLQDSGWQTVSEPKEGDV